METNYPEVREFLQELINRGFELYSYNDGEETTITNNLDKVVEGVFSVDECFVSLYKDNKCATLAFVLGNEAGVAMADFSCHYTLEQDIDEVSEMIYNKYNQ